MLRPEHDVKLLHFPMLASKRSLRRAVCELVGVKHKSFPKKARKGTA